MNLRRTQKIITAALVASMICAVNMLIRIPIPGVGGYMNIGDIFIITGGIILGPVYGMLSAAVGGFISDLISGFTIYIPATAIIKALISFAAYLFFSKSKCNFRLKLILCSLLPEIFAAVLYASYDTVIVNEKNVFIVSLAYNMIQSIVSGAFAFAALSGLNRLNILEKLRGNKNGNL